MCTAGGQNVHRGLINLKAADNRRGRGNRSGVQSGRAARQKGAFDLGKAELYRSVGWEWENGMWNSLL